MSKRGAPCRRGTAASRTWFLVGTISAIGDGVEELRVGDRVAAVIPRRRPGPRTGSFAEHVLALGVAGMGIPPVGTGLAVRFAPTAPTLAAAIAVAAFNGGTAIGTWLGAKALESDLGTLGPLTVGLVMAALGVIALAAMAAFRLTEGFQKA